MKSQKLLKKKKKEDKKKQLNKALMFTTNLKKDVNGFISGNKLNRIQEFDENEEDTPRG